MNKIYKFSAWWMLCFVLLSSLTFTACDTNDLDTNQYKGGISLNVFGPSPVLHVVVFSFFRLWTGSSYICTNSRM